MRHLVPVVIDGLAALPALLWVLVASARTKRGAALSPSLRAVLWAVVISLLLAHVNRWFDLWKAHPNFPSGHEAFASCCGMALALQDRRWIVPVLLLLAVLGYALVRTGWHTRIEVIGGFVLGTVVMGICAQVNAARAHMS